MMWQVWASIFYIGWTFRLILRMASSAMADFELELWETIVTALLLTVICGVFL